MAKMKPGELELHSLEDVEIEMVPRLGAAHRFALPLWAMAGAVGVAFVANGGYAFWTAGPLASSLLGLQFLAFAVLALCATLCGLRAASAQDIEARNEGLREWQSEAAAMSQRQGRGDVLRRYASPMYNLGALERLGMWLPFALALSALASLAVCVRSLLAPLPDAASYASTSWLMFVAGALNLVLAFACVMLGSWLRGQAREDLPEAKPLAALLKALQWVSLLASSLTFARALGLDNIASLSGLAEAWLGRALLVVVACVALEAAAMALLAGVARRKSWGEVRAPLSAVVADNVFVSPRALAETLSTLEARLGLNVRSSYVVASLRRALPLVGAAVFAMLWLSTSMVMIGTEETGVLTRFGQRIRLSPLGPGLHLKLPFPIDAVRVVASERVQVAYIGPQLDLSKPVLWTKMHAAGGDYNQVLGQGREVVSVHARVFFRVKDAQNFLFNTQNPADVVESMAYQVVMREVVRRDIDQILSLDRIGFSQRLRSTLQSDLDAQSLGIEVLSFPLIGLHPPVDVARDYQSVVSAQIQEVTLATQANVDRTSKVPAAQAARDATVKGAQGNAARRLGLASGEATRFKAAENAYHAAPQLFRERLWMETMDETLAGKKLYVVDRKPGAPPPDYTVDLRGGASIP